MRSNRTTTVHQPSIMYGIYELEFSDIEAKLAKKKPIGVLQNFKIAKVLEPEVEQEVESITPLKPDSPRMELGHQIIQKEAQKKNQRLSAAENDKDTVAQPPTQSLHFYDADSSTSALLSFEKKNPCRVAPFFIDQR